MDGKRAPFVELDVLYWGVPVEAGAHRVMLRCWLYLVSTFAVWTMVIRAALARLGWSDAPAPK